MANKDRQDLARYLLKPSEADDPPQLTAGMEEWAYGEVLRIQRERIERLEAALAWYADKDNWIYWYDVDSDDMITEAEKDGGLRAHKALER